MKNTGVFSFVNKPGQWIMAKAVLHSEAGILS